MWPEVTVDGTEGRHLDGHGFPAAVHSLEGPRERMARRPGWRSRTGGSTEIASSSARTWRLSRTPPPGIERLLEFTLRFEATDRPVQIVGTPDGKKGFGGFCFRFAPRDGGTEATVIRTDQGIAKKDGVLSRHPWAEISGSFKGQPAGARVEDMPTNPGYPNNGWLMRHGFGFLNVSYPGLEPITTRAGQASGAEVPRPPLLGRRSLRWNIMPCDRRAGQRGQSHFCGVLPQKSGQSPTKSRFSSSSYHQKRE